MKNDEQDHFPSGTDFLMLLQEVGNIASESADEFMKTAGEKLPASMVHLGNLLSHLYQLSCCAWGCSKGDHVLEWLAGRIVNQAMSAHRLIRAANYDESLVLIRGMGEAANLLWLFVNNDSELKNWKTASRKDRISIFGPAAVRKRLESKFGGTVIPIDKERYQRLSEISTHPVAGSRPGHFTGTGKPILGGILQEAGIFVCMTELGYTTSMCSLALAHLTDIPEEKKKEIKKESKLILDDLGAFTILNYEEMLREIYKKEQKNNSIDSPNTP